MPITELAAILGAVAVVGYVLSTLIWGVRPHWQLPAALSAAFALWSVVAVVQEGPLGFWPVHSQTLWGNQVWFDLLFAVAIGWVLIEPRARTQGMRRLPWLAFILASGCIGFLAMLARLWYLENEKNRA